MTTPEAAEQPANPPQPPTQPPPTQPPAPPPAPPHDPPSQRFAVQSPFSQDPPSQPFAVPASPPTAGHQPPTRPGTAPRRAPIIALTALAAVFALVAGVFTALHAGERADRDAIAASRADRERALADVTNQQDDMDQALEDNRSRESALDIEHDLLTRCVDAAKAYFALPPERSPESSRLFRIMYDVCPQI